MGNQAIGLKTQVSGRVLETITQSSASRRVTVKQTIVSHAVHHGKVMQSVESQSCSVSCQSHAFHRVKAMHFIVSKSSSPSCQSHAVHRVTVMQYIVSLQCSPSCHSHAVHRVTVVHSIVSKSCSPSCQSHAVRRQSANMMLIINHSSFARWRVCFEYRILTRVSHYDTRVQLNIRQYAQ